MDKLFIQLSKTGDLCGILPIAYAASQRGEKVGIMASKEFADILDGVSYAEKIVFDDKPWLIKEAFEQAKKLCENVVVTMTNGPVAEIEKYAYGPAGQKHAVTDSFCRESWKLAGCLKDWGKIPLAFDKRDRAREDALMPKGWFTKGRKKKIMLVSAGSVSSPFPYRDLLMKLLTLNYPNFNIIDLGLIKAERFYDLLGLYEAAHCLVSVDTAHLHLAAAVPTLPVMALIQDRPIYWYGSAWRPSHHFHCRYRDFPRRAMELFTAIDNVSMSEPGNNILQVYHGGVHKNDAVRYFPIQPGSCRRDAVNCLDDKEHFPMLQDVIRMVMQVAKPNDVIHLCREDTKSELSIPREDISTPRYAFRMNRDKDGNDTFFPAVDLFAAPVDFWVKIFPSIPDVVMGADAYWPRILMEIFRANGAVEISGVFRNDF
jgi:hypothetical protein